MKTQLRLVFMMAALALATVPVVGCGGSECGSGTTEKDGECVAVDSNNTSGEDSCGSGTTYDADSEKCVSDDGEGTTCGSGTVEEDGVCVPSEGLKCGPKTSEDEDGNCVISADACEDGETLDPNTGDCVVGNGGAECGAGTALDSDSGECVPTADVCDEGTTFDEDSGLCLPGTACSAGDVLVNGVCSDPAEELASNADLTETENNDPNLGGTAEALTVKDIGSTTVFTGTIGAPEDLDTDGELDQDLDSFSFDASEGDWFELSVQSTGLPSPIFIVEGPDFTRFSPGNQGSDTARQIVIPADGTYTVTVAPLSSVYGAQPVGGDEWGYVGSLAQIDAPTPTDVDLSADTLSGDYGSLSDGFYELTGFDAGALVTLNIDASGSGAQGVLSLWNSATEFGSEVAISEGDTVDLIVPASGEVFAVLDWAIIEGPSVGYEISGVVSDDFEALGTLGDDSNTSTTPTDLAEDGVFKYTFSVSAGQVIEISHANAEDVSVNSILTDASGNTLLSSSSTSNYRYWYSETGGTYVLTLDNSSFSAEDLTDVVATISTITPSDLGAVDVGDSVSESVSTVLENKRSDFYIFTANTPLSVSGDVTSANDEDVDVYFLDGANVEIGSSTAVGSETISDIIVPAGTVLMEVLAYEEIPSYDVNLTFADAPQMEVEPNETDAEATAFDLSTDLLATSGDGSDVDVFSFSPASDMASGEVLTLEVLQDGFGSDEYICTLRDSSGNAVGVSNPNATEDGCLSQASALMASETYYLEVARDSGTSEVDYVLSARIEMGTLEVEPNDTDADATSFDMTALVSGTDLFGQLPLDTDVDYFTFDLAADQAGTDFITLSAARIGSNPTSGVSWAVLDSSLTEVVAGDLDEELLLTGLTQDTYYLKVSRTSTTASLSGAYQISAVEAASVCGDSTIEGGETCDDGNTDDGDGCSSTCQLPVPTASVTDSTPATFDSTTPTHTATATVSGCTAPVSSVNVDVDITHAYHGDLNIDLVSPDGTTVRLQESGFNSSPDIIGNYPRTLTVDGPGSLADFVGETGDGDWQLVMEDTYPGSDNGTFNSFTVNVFCD